MNGPDGKPMHAELRLRDTTLMLGPEGPQARSCQIDRLDARPTVSHGGSCRQSYRQGVKLGARLLVTVRDQFWGDRTGTNVDPEGNTG